MILAEVVLSLSDLLGHSGIVVMLLNCLGLAGNISLLNPVDGCVGLGCILSIHCSMLVCI